MLRILRKLAGLDIKAEARQALSDAHRSVADADSRTLAVDQVTGRINAHGRRNHFGERWEALARRIDLPEGTP